MGGGGGDEAVPNGRLSDTSALCSAERGYQLKLDDGVRRLTTCYQMKSFDCIQRLISCFHMRSYNFCVPRSLKNLLWQPESGLDHPGAGAQWSLLSSQIPWSTT